MTPEEWAWSVPVSGPDERATILALVKLRDPGTPYVRAHADVVQQVLGGIASRTLSRYLQRLGERGLVAQCRTGGRGGLNLRLGFETPPEAAQTSEAPVQAAQIFEAPPEAAQNYGLEIEAPPEAAQTRRAPLGPPSPPTPPLPPVTPQGMSRDLADAASSSEVGGGSAPATSYNGRGKFASAPLSDQKQAARLATTYYRAAGLNWDGLTRFMQNRELAIGLDLVGVGATPEESVQFVTWCQQERGRPSPVDMRAYESARERFLHHPEDNRGRRPAPPAGLVATRSIRTANGQP